jgi:hypothetical protein
MNEISESSFADLVTWAMCKMADGGGPGKCDPEHCVCGAEGRFVARRLHEMGFRLYSLKSGNDCGSVEIAADRPNQ